MKKKILSGLFACISAAAFAVNVNWNNTLITGSAQTLMGTKMTKDNNNKVYYIGSDRNVYFIDLSNPSYPVTNLSALCTNTVEPAASYSDLVALSPWQILYVGLNGRVMNYWLNGTNWNCDQLTYSGPNVLTGTGLAVDEYGRVHYIGTDSRIYQVTYTGTGWSPGPFPLPAVNPRPYSDLVAKQGHVYYQGTDMKLHNYYWTTSWNFGVLNGLAPNAASGTNIEVDENGRVSYVASDNKVYYLEWNSTSGWVSTQVNSTKTAKLWGSPRAQLYEGKIYFVDGTNNTISFFFKPNAGVWDFANIYYNGTTPTSYHVAGKTDILVTNNGDVIYNDADSKLHLLSPVVSWKSVTALTGLTGDFILSPAGETSISRLKCPKDMQLYPRDATDYGTVPFEGGCWGFKTITIRVDKTPLTGSPTWSTQVFSLDQFCDFVGSIGIHAELSEYAFSYKLNGQTNYTPIASRVVCGDAYLVSGQSNTTGDQTNDEPTLEAMYGEFAPGGYGKYSRAYGNGAYFFCDSWGVTTAFPPTSANYCVTSVGNSFTLSLQYKLQQANQVPTCVIHNGIGAQEISRFLNPAGHAAGELYFNFFCAPQWENAFQGIQNHMIRRIYETGLENNIKAFIWYQGEGDVSMHSAYKAKFKQMYDELAAWVPNIPRTYLVQIHSSPSTSTAPIEMGEVLRTMPSYVPYANIRVLSSNGVRHPNCEGIHFDIYGYIEIAQHLFDAIRMDLYGAPYNIANLPPDIIGATIDASTLKLTIQFNQTLSAMFSDNLNDVIRAVRCNNGAVLSAPLLNNDKLIMTVSSAAGLTSVSYLGALPCNTGTPSPVCPASHPNYNPLPSALDWWCPCYLRNTNDIGALTFANFPVTPGIPSGRLAGNTEPAQSLSMQLFPNPVSGNELTIFSVSFSGPVSVRIYSPDGKLVMEKEVLQENGIGRMPIALESGIYLVTCEDAGGNRYTEKLVVHQP